MSMLQLENLSTHHINCCQYYYLFILCTANANKKLCPKPLLRATWDAFEKLTDAGNTSVLTTMEFGVLQFELIDFFSSVSCSNLGGLILDNAL